MLRPDSLEVEHVFAELRPLQQSAWAATAGLALDAKGYLTSWQENLYQPMSASALASFRSGSGNELLDSRDRAAKMRASHSSSALVVNVFDYLTGNADRVLDALGLTPGGESVSFAAQFPTGLDGNPPNLDMCVSRTDGRLVGVESKVTEWLAPKPASKEYFKPKYFPQQCRLWERRGLRAAQLLAEDIHARVKHFRYLDAPQLLKHMLGLASTERQFDLYYLYFAVVGPEAAVHRAEIQEFKESVAGDPLSCGDEPGGLLPRASESHCL
jgi:hypothetical protein